MDIVSSVLPAGAPTYETGVRPAMPATAQAAAPETKRPEFTPPAPASPNQKAAVARARLVEELPGSRAMKAPERALKPYGVAMLPDRPVEMPDPSAADADEPALASGDEPTVEAEAPLPFADQDADTTDPV